MNRYLKSIPLGVALALAIASASAQTPAPARTASAPATLGVTPQDAAQAQQQAVPRSDTGTVVRTAPSPASRASAALNGSSTGSTSTTTGTTGSAAPMTGTTGDAAMGTTRRARADRN